MVRAVTPPCIHLALNRFEDVVPGKVFLGSIVPSLGTGIDMYAGVYSCIVIGLLIINRASDRHFNGGMAQRQRV